MPIKPTILMPEEISELQDLVDSIIKFRPKIKAFERDNGTVWEFELIERIADILGLEVSDE